MTYYSLYCFLWTKHITSHQVHCNSLLTDDPTSALVPSDYSQHSSLGNPMKVKLCYFSASVHLMASIPAHSISQHPVNNLHNPVPHHLSDLIIFTLFLFPCPLPLPQTEQVTSPSGTCTCSLVCVESSPVSCLTPGLHSKGTLL